MTTMRNATLSEWVDEQFSDHGWSEDEIKRGKKYNSGGKWALIGGFLCLIIVTIPIGFPMFLVGAYRISRYQSPGEAYQDIKHELEDEHRRRKKAGEPLWEPVDDQWWEDRERQFTDSGTVDRPWWRTSLFTLWRQRGSSSDDDSIRQR